jgi:hypothetical protein
MAASGVFRLGSVFRGVGARPLKLMINQIQLDKDTQETPDGTPTVTSTTAIVPYAPLASQAPHVPFSGFKVLPDLVVFRVGFRSHSGSF